MRTATRFFLATLVSTTLAGCESGWPPGHVCDQELPLTFSGMMGLGSPNGDGTFARIINACDNQDFDDDKKPAGGDGDDTVNEYDWDLEGETTGWIPECVYEPPEGSYYTGPTKYEYDQSCRDYWRRRLVVNCDAWDNGTIQEQIAHEDMQFEEDAYTVYCSALY